MEDDSKSKDDTKINKISPEYGSIINEPHPCVLYKVSKLAALAQALITFGSPWLSQLVEPPEHPEQDMPYYV